MPQKLFIKWNINPNIVATKDQYLRTNILIIQVNALKLPESHLINQNKNIILTYKSFKKRCDFQVWLRQMLYKC